MGHFNIKREPVALLDLCSDSLCSLSFVDGDVARGADCDCVLLWSYTFT